jgi:hypothetical protein
MAEMGLPDVERWVSYALDLDEIAAARITVDPVNPSDSSIIEPGMVEVFFKSGGNCFLNEQYKSFVKLWKGQI